MAKIDLKFLDFSDESWISCYRELGSDDETDCISIKVFSPYGGSNINHIQLDKSTAIKFAKTLRTEINKIES